jgi:hypothetical protein
MHDRRDRVEEGERALAGQPPIASASASEVSGPVATMTLSQSSGGRPAISLALDGYERMAENGRFDAVREAVAVDRERASGRHLMRVGVLEDDRTERAHLAMQDPDRVGRGVVGTERIRADELGEMAGLVRGGARLGRISCSTTGTPAPPPAMRPPSRPVRRR